jgi:hypothetical protein
MSTFKVFTLSERKVIWTNVFKGKQYVHMKDKAKDKSLSFSIDEFQELYKKQRKLMAFIEKSLKKQKKSKKKSKKRKYEDSDSSEDDRKNNRKKKRNESSDDEGGSDDEEEDDE